MPDLLKRSVAPVTTEAWEEIDETAARVLKSQLTGRRIVEVDGPHGWQYGAVNTGRLHTAAEPGPNDVPWGQRVALPLVETRLPFQLDQMELDSVSRGVQDADLDALEGAARRIALFEETAVYNGFEEGGIRGIATAAAHPPVPLPENGRQIPATLARAVEMMTLAGIAGPFALILDRDQWAGLMQGGAGGYPPQRIIRELNVEQLQMSPVVEGGLAVSLVPGYFQLTLGQDFSVGYAGHDAHTVELFLAESFTFRVLEPKAAVRLTPGTR